MRTVENVFRILDENGIKYKKTEHEEVKTSQEAAAVRGVPLSSGVKALLLRTTEKNFLMVLVRADKKVDFKKIAELESTKKVSMASPEEVLVETGCEIGGVPPFGHTKDSKPHKITTYFDKEILENKEVNFNAGDRRISVTMMAADLSKAVGEYKEI